MLNGGSALIGSERLSQQAEIHSSARWLPHAVGVDAHNAENEHANI